MALETACPLWVARGEELARLNAQGREPLPDHSQHQLPTSTRHAPAPVPWGDAAATNGFVRIKEDEFKIMSQRPRGQHL